MLKGLKSACPGVSTEKWRPGQQKRTACGEKGENKLALRISHVTLICFCTLNYSWCSSYHWEGSDLFQWLHLCCGSLGTDFWEVLENLSKTQIKDISTGSGMYCHKPSQGRIIFCCSSSSAFSELRNLVSFMEHDSADLHSAISCGQCCSTGRDPQCSSSRAQLHFRGSTSFLRHFYPHRIGRREDTCGISACKTNIPKDKNSHHLLVTIQFIFILHTILVQFFCSDNWERW